MADRLCAKCKYMSDPGVYAKCNHPNTAEAKVSILTGFPPKESYCSVQRTYDAKDYTCGPSGQWFEPDQQQPEAASGACEVVT